MKKIIVVALLSVIATGCNIITASGPMVTDTRDHGDFDAVNNETSIDVRIESAAADFSVIINCHDNVVEHLLTQVEDGELRIYTEGLTMFNDTQDCAIAVTLPLLTQVHTSGSGDIVASGATVLASAGSSGSGDIVVNDVSAESLSIGSSGSGDIAVCGTALSVTMSSSGSGNMDNECMITNGAEITGSGSGDHHLTVNGAASVVISGSGNVHLYGDTQLTDQTTAGSGEVTLHE